MRRGRARRRPEPGRCAAPTLDRLRGHRDARHRACSSSLATGAARGPGSTAARCTAAARLGIPKEPDALGCDAARPRWGPGACATDLRRGASGPRNGRRRHRARSAGATARPVRRSATSSRSSTAPGSRAARRPAYLENGLEEDILLRGHAGRQPAPGCCATPTPEHSSARRGAARRAPPGFVFVVNLGAIHGGAVYNAHACNTRSGSSWSSTPLVAMQLDRDDVPVPVRRISAAALVDRATINGVTALKRRCRGVVGADGGRQSPVMRDAEK